MALNLNSRKISITITTLTLLLVSLAPKPIDSSPPCLSNNRTESWEESTEEKEGEASSADRISGGFKATWGQFPAYVLVKVRERGGKTSMCGGTILSERHIVTAAHCIQPRISQAWIEPTIFLWDSSVERIPVAKICISKLYGGLGMPNGDVAILRLKKSLQFSKNIQPAKLIDRRLTGRDQVYAVGLGLTSYRLEKWPEQLQVLPMKMVPCYFFEAHWTRICFRFSDKRYTGDQCRGDSGGGIFAVRDGTQYLTGITSFGVNKCEPNTYWQPSVNADIYNLRDEIKSLLERCP